MKHFETLIHHCPFCFDAYFIMVVEEWLCFSKEHISSPVAKKKDFDTKRIKMFVVISLSVFPSFCCLPIWHTLTPFMMDEQHSSVCCLDCQHTMKWAQADNPLTNGWCLQTLLLYSVLDPETFPNSNNFYPPSFLSVFTSCILSGVLELLQTF